MANDRREIDPKSLEIDWQGSGQIGRKGVSLRLSVEITLDLLGNDPTIWKRVQAQRGGMCSPLRVHDVVYAIASDETWAAMATVKRADAQSVSFADWRKITLDGRPEVTWEDKNFRVMWDGDAYCAFRKSDDLRMMAWRSPSPDRVKLMVVNSYGVAA